MIDLIEQLSPAERETIINYIDHYGINKNNFIGLDKWLQNWNHSNQILYKLLGNKFIHEIDFSCKKSKEDLKREVLSELLTLPFCDIYNNFISRIFELNEENLVLKTSEKCKIKFNLYEILHWQTIVENAIDNTIKYKKENSKKILQLQKGMKPIKALSKILEYFSDEFKEINPAYKEEFEKFRLKHSVIMNDKNLKGKLCFSIHPLDYMTMSDNSLNWESCMSWTQDGCYRIGTVEMMNSNNVLCCYFKSKEPYNFAKNDKEFNIWNNKRWRTLAYYTKDIIMSGKSYPYYNENLNKLVIKEIKKLSEENLNHSYSFGPELYKDMQRVNTINDMELNREWMEYNNIKHNIIWDTRGMYNDVFNDNDTNYWCYRNKIKNKKIINISGKAPCLCCGEQVPSFSEWDEYYNDRYDNLDSLLCQDCKNEFLCDYCNSKLGEKSYIIKKQEENKKEVVEKHICERCYKNYIKLCPCCGEPFDLFNANVNNYYCSKTLIHKKLIDNEKISITNPIGLRKPKKNFLEYVYVCKNCLDEKRDIIFPVKKQLFYHWSKRTYTQSCLPNTFWAEKYRYKNLKDVPLDFEGVIKN